LSVSTLLVDARPLDHPTARQRGIGRYVTGLLAGLRDIDAPVIALFGSDTEADVLAATVPGITAEPWSPQTVRRHVADGTWYLATQLMLHPIPLDPIPRCITDSHLPVAAVMYDVIPYRYPELYLEEPNARRQADLRAPLTRTIDTLLAISDFAASTAAVELDYPRERISTIGAGVDQKFMPASGDPRQRCRRVLPVDVERYVVAVAGGDERKNTEGLLRAWAHVDRGLGGVSHLVIAAAHTASVRERWQRWAADAQVLDRVVFTGGVDDDELVALFQGAELAVMPSLEEGFGLPVLEAAACGVPAISSNVSSLPEVLDEPEACFDPHDPEAIAAAIVRALTDDTHRSVLLGAGRRAAERWTWPHVAQATLDSLADLGPRWPQRARPPAPRVALAGRFADASSSPDRLGRRNTGVLDALRSGGVDVVALVDNATSPDPTYAAPDRWPVRSVGRFVHPWDFDAILAVLGAAPDHLATSAMARTVPCHLWIHDDAVVGARFGANLQALEVARSVIVGSIEAAHQLRRAADRPSPILVIPATASDDEAATALAVWLGEAVDLDPLTIRHAQPGLATGAEPSPISSPDP
jgi:glycosyltransferase involved in cell wall biosynthesis